MSHRFRAIAGLFQKFAAGGVCEGFSGELHLITDETGWQFDDTFLHRDSELLDEDDLVVRGDGEDADCGVGIRPPDEIPVAYSVNSEPAGLEKGLWSGHDVNRGKKRWHTGVKRDTASAP